MTDISDALIHFVETRKKIIDDNLIRVSLPKNENNTELIPSIKHSVSAEGKRLRPLLFLALLESFGIETGNAEGYATMACSFEIMHAASLIHDDLPCMDNSDLRRGKPANHVVFGEAIAVLTGDALLNSALKCMLDGGEEAGLAPQTILHILKIISFYLDDTVDGQAVEYNLRGIVFSEDALMDILEKKTASLFKAIFSTASITAGKDEKTRLRLNETATYFGTAFQIADDVLDMIADERTMGKNTGNDDRNQITTYPKLAGIEAACEKVDFLLKKTRCSLQNVPLQSDLLPQLMEYSTVERIQTVRTG